MAEPHVVTALVRKRAELAGEVQTAEKRLGQLRANLVHLDATLRLFSPTANPEKIGPKRPYRRREWFKNGELPRLVLGALREATAPMSTRELALAAMASKGMNAGDAATVGEVRNAIGGYLRRHRGELLASEVGPGQAMLWRLMRSDSSCATGTFVE